MLLLILSEQILDSSLASRVDLARAASETRGVPSEQAWAESLRSEDQVTQARAAAELRDYLRRTLAKGFGRQLVDADLDDITQESLLKIHRKLDTFGGQSRFTTWAATIAVNYAVSELRRRRHQHVSLEDAAEQADWSADATTSEAEVELLRRGINEALTERQRIAIEAALGGLPLSELARRQGVSQGAVYKLLHDARCRLRIYLAECAENRGTVQEALS